MEKLTYKSNQHKSKDWVTISVGVIMVVYIIGLIIVSHKLGIQLQ